VGISNEFEDEELKLYEFLTKKGFEVDKEKIFSTNMTINKYGQFEMLPETLTTVRCGKDIFTLSIRQKAVFLNYDEDKKTYDEKFDFSKEV